MRKSFSLDQNKKTKKQIDVLFYYNGRDQYARPVKLTWNGEDYALGGVQFWYAEHSGRTLVHHYQVSDQDDLYTFYLSLETENMTWKLDRVIESAPRTQFGQKLVGAVG